MRGFKILLNPRCFLGKYLHIYSYYNFRPGQGCTMWANAQWHALFGNVSNKDSTFELRKLEQSIGIYNNRRRYI